MEIRIKGSGMHQVKSSKTYFMYTSEVPSLFYSFETPTHQR